MVDQLIELKVNILFVVGGDGTQRGGKAIGEEACGAATDWRWWVFPRPSTTIWPIWTRVSDTKPPALRPSMPSPRRIPKRAVREMASGLSS